MKLVVVNESTISNMRNRLSLDYVCWIGATIALVWTGYPTIAALVGATGIMYLRYVTKKYRQWKYQIEMVLAFAKEARRYAELAPTPEQRELDEEYDDPFDDDSQWPNP